MMDNEEFLALSRELEKHHAIFNRLWALGRPILTEDLPTAGVSFDKVGNCIEFKINPKFWATLTLPQKLFILSHECLHVILYHGIRINNLKGEAIRIANLALDVVVNHALVDRFGFTRAEVDPKNIYCWVDTVFKEPPESGKYYEFYYNLLEKSDLSGMGSLDDHSDLSSFNTPEFEDMVKEFISQDDLGSLPEFVEGQVKDIENECKEAGCSPGNTFVIVRVKVKEKKKWETVIKNWARRSAKDFEEEQWVKPPKYLMCLSSDLMLPSDEETDYYEKDKVDVWFFQDTSGSCSHFAKRFFGAARSLPKERFDVRMHCFDTRVYETTLESGKLYGFGGTSFSCIESYIQKTLKNKGLRYPKAVFLITDGYGDHVTPQYPKNWYWFIDGSMSLVPKESHKFNLRDFE